MFLPMDLYPLLRAIFAFYPSKNFLELLIKKRIFLKMIGLTMLWVIMGFNGQASAYSSLLFQLAFFYAFLLHILKSTALCFSK
jgi:hypothetical protein